MAEAAGRGLRSSDPPAESVQVDFFAVTVELNGERRRVWKFLVRLMYSDRDFTLLDERQDQAAFLDGQVRAFGHFGGVPQRMVYGTSSRLCGACSSRAAN